MSPFQNGFREKYFHTFWPLIQKSTLEIFYNFNDEDPNEENAQLYSTIEDWIYREVEDSHKDLSKKIDRKIEDVLGEFNHLGDRLARSLKITEEKVMDSILHRFNHFYERLAEVDKRIAGLEFSEKHQQEQNKTFMNELDMVRGSPGLGGISPIPQNFSKPKNIDASKPNVNKSTKVTKFNLDEDFDVEDADKKDDGKKIKRESILKRLSTGVDAPVHAVTYTRVAPPYTHIKLERLTLSQMIRFMEDIFIYTNSYKISLPVTTLIHSKVRDQIIAHQTGMTWNKFHALRLDELLPMLLQEVRPASPVIFYKALQYHAKIELPHTYRPSPLDFKLFYNALLVYKDKFIRVYEMLGEDNESNIPPCNNKEGGLIRLFIEGIPFQYGTKKFQVMSATDKRYTNIYVFLHDFMKSVEDDFERSKEATIMSHNFVEFMSCAPQISAGTCGLNTYFKNRRSFAEAARQADLQPASSGRVTRGKCGTSTVTKRYRNGPLSPARGTAQQL